MATYDPEKATRIIGKIAYHDEGILYDDGFGNKGVTSPILLFVFEKKKLMREKKR